LQAEENRLTRELPFSQQRALDAAEVEADTKSYAAAAALKEAKREMQARLRESGFAKTHEKHLDEIVEHADAIIALRAEAGKASNAFHKASMAAARHRGELPRQV